MLSALIVSGGWDGHRPFEVAAILQSTLEQAGFRVTSSTELDSFKSSADYDLVVPNWTMGRIEAAQADPLIQAVAAGVGLAGLHGGAGDAFREHTEYQFLVGGQFVAHPGNDGTRYVVHTIKGSPITTGIDDFDVVSEQYYMHIDPAITAVATTTFAQSGTVMPVAWTKTYGEGRVYYCSLGHDPEVASMPQNLSMFARGATWAARRPDTALG